MFNDPTTIIALAEANHRAQVRAAALREASADRAADRNFLRRSTGRFRFRIGRRT